jgi:PAS domain S-box-containing protein
MSARLWHNTYEYGLKPFIIAVVFVLVALLWTFPLQHWMEYPFVFLFFAAIMGSAWFGGTIAGFIAVVLSSLVVTFFFIPPLYSITVARESESFLAAFVLFSITTSIVSSSRKRTESEIRKAKDLLETKVLERTAELERSNREIRQSESQLRKLTEAIPQQIWRADARGSIEYVNQHLRDYLGSPEGMLFGDRLFRTIHPQDAHLVQENWQRSIESGSSLEVEARIRSAGGGYRWFLIRAFPQHAEDGTIERWYGLHIDIEELQREQQSLTARQETLSRLSRTLSMSEVAASIAHELNQPITALVTHAYACREWACSDPPNLNKVTATADKMIRESNRASEVVRRVRALFSNDEPVRVPANINSMIEDSARLLRDEAIREGVSVVLQLAKGLPEAEIDPVQIQQVILNLSRNAIEAMAASAREKTLTITTARLSEAEIAISTHDTGPGINPELLPAVFEPFFSTKKNGTGIGLAICRSIVESHNGHISVENGTDGAIARFTIPIRS